MVSVKKIKEVHEFYSKNGIEKTMKIFNLSRESISRYSRAYKKLYLEEKETKGQDKKVTKRDSYITSILKDFSDDELKNIVKSGSLIHGKENNIGQTKIDYVGKRFRYGYLGDTHIGSVYFDPSYLDFAFETFRKEKVDFWLHGGDVTEGMSHRAGHIYECTELGYTNQKKRAIELLSQWDETNFYVIDGNHDRWFIKSNGAYIVPDICEAIPNAHFLGHDEGDLVLENGPTIKLWHGEDGSSYAISYRVQKVIESLSGGEKPHIMHLAHTHKFGYIFERNIHAVSGGSIQKQSKWMRGKRLSAHTCFQIFDVTFNDRGVAKFVIENYPFYQ